MMCRSASVSGLCLLNIYIYKAPLLCVCVCMCFSPKFELVPLINETKRNEMDIDLSELNVLF